jgi:hypothetical protein
MVREWTPKFHPPSSSIDKVLVWIRFLGLLLEYYDVKVLVVVGDQIGRVVKVDKTMNVQQIGKYEKLLLKLTSQNL